jgi:hypothetical protein
MGFFTRKPNPPVPVKAQQLLRGIGSVSPPHLPSQQVRNALNQAQAGQLPMGKPENEQQAQSNTRFRSFAERYIVERCRDWKESEIDERAWEAILQARSIYNKVKEVGRTLGPDT